MTRLKRAVSAAALGLVLGAVAFAQTSATQFDSSIQSNVMHRLGEKNEFRRVNSSVEDGIVTLTGSVDVYQQKLDAAKRSRKAGHVQGVRNLIAVTGKTVTDAELAAQLERRIYYDRVGYYDNAFNYVTVSVKDGVASVSGATLNYLGRDYALDIVNNTPGVKDVVDHIAVLPTSQFDDSIRLRAERAIYGDSVLGRYGIDPASPIRIVVDNGHLSLYGTVERQMDKDIAGIRANQVFGAFSVTNHLTVDSKS